MSTVEERDKAHRLFRRVVVVVGVIAMLLVSLGLWGALQVLLRHMR